MGHADRLCCVAIKLYCVALTSMHFLHMMQQASLNVCLPAVLLQEQQQKEQS